MTDKAKRDGDSPEEVQTKRRRPLRYLTLIALLAVALVSAVWQWSSTKKKLSDLAAEEERLTRELAQLTESLPSHEEVAEKQELGQQLADRVLAVQKANELSMRLVGLLALQAEDVRVDGIRQGTESGETVPEGPSQLAGIPLQPWEIAVVGVAQSRASARGLVDRLEGGDWQLRVERFEVTPKDTDVEGFAYDFYLVVTATP